MVLEKLGGSLREALRKIAGASYVDESLIKEIVRDIQRALIQADVNVQLAFCHCRGRSGFDLHSSRDLYKSLNIVLRIQCRGNFGLVR